MIENILTTWFHLYRIEADHANQDKSTLGADLFYERILNAAQQRYLACMQALARLRKRELPPVQINVANKQVNVAGNVNATEAPPG